jgi:ParB-like chromosome segregation protein Spo0J
MESIPAIVLEGLDADEAELREIDENLIRADLTDAERAAHHARRQELHQQKHPETKHGGDRKGKKSSGQNGHSNERYTKETAPQTGESERTVRRHVARGKKIANVADVVGTSLDKGNELDALAKMSPERQSELIEKAKAGEKVSARDSTKGSQQPVRKPKTASPDEPKPKPVPSPPIAPSAPAEEKYAPAAGAGPPGASALPLSVSAPSVARPADTLPPRAATSLPRESSEPPSREQSDPAFDLACEAPGGMNSRRMINNLGARTVWQAW